MKAKFDKATGLIFSYWRLLLSFLLLLTITVVLLRLLGHQIPGLRLGEANMQSLGIIIAAMAYALNR